jgi:hypothetical protein
LVLFLENSGGNLHSKYSAEVSVAIAVFSQTD